MNTLCKAKKKTSDLLERGHNGPLAVVSFWEHERARAIEDLQKMMSRVCWRRSGNDIQRHVPRRRPRVSFEAGNA